MGLDTKYRPLRYGDVLGQDTTIAVCKQIVREGKAFQQSYVFAGAYGSGKTTTGRILARAMLCASPKDGEPCDECLSCKAILADASEDFIEVDAATNSGKEHVKRITEEALYGSFSGNRKIYLFDECFTEDTMLLTPEGPESIRDIVSKKYKGLVLSCDLEADYPSWETVINWFEIKDERECLLLEFDNGVSLTLTTNQEIYTKNRGWISALNITKEDVLSEVTLSTLPTTGGVPRFRGAGEARLVSFTSVGKKKVYDITVDGKHSFFAYSRFGTPEHAILVHNCHEMSKQAMDALLKPLEDNLRGTQDKQLVCIFCTTEPNKMRPAIMSRCAPAFKIHTNSPEEIGKRLAFICNSENIEYDPDVLPLIAEVCECHVRDTIKAVEGVSMLGAVNRDNVERYLHLDANALYLEILENIGTDLTRVLQAIEKLIERVSPATCFEKMADLSMLAYRLVCAGSEISVPSFWDRERLNKIGNFHREFLVNFAQVFSQRPTRPTSAMFVCDVSSLHQRRAGISTEPVKITSSPLETSSIKTPSTLNTSSLVLQEAPQKPSQEVPFEATVNTPLSSIDNSSLKDSSETNLVTESTVEIPPSPTSFSEQNSVNGGNISQDSYVNDIGVHINPTAQQHKNNGSLVKNLPTMGIGPFPSNEFTKTLHRRFLELTEEALTSGRSARRDNMGSS